MSKISQLTALTSLADGDLVPVVDVSDTTQAASGSTKKIAASDAKTYFSSGGFANPMTTLGDLMYEDATPAAARLAGNTTTTRKFLRQAGTGAVSAAPAWDTVAAGDLPHGDWLQAHQFRPEDYGAKGDGKVIGDLVLNSTTTATSATAAFTSADTGKTIMINGGAGTAAAPLVTTITFVNATTVTLGSAASVTGTAFQAVYGTDDTAAVNSAVSAASTYAQANNYFCEVLFGAKTYMLASGPTQTGNGTTTPTFNAQVSLPYPAAAGTSRKLIIALTGAGDAGHTQYWESLTPNLAGTCLVSTVTAPLTPNATFGIQSVIGGPSGSAGFTGGFANVKVSVRGLSVWCGMFTNSYAFDFGYVSQMRVEKSSAHIFAPTGVNGGNQPYLTAIASANTIGSGFRTPVDANNDDSTMDDVAVSGYDCHFRIFDHFTAGRLASVYSDVAVKWDGTQGASGTAHGLFIQAISAEAYNGGLLTNGGSCQVDINWDAEGVPSAYDVSDSGNALYGELRFGDKVDDRAPVVTGAANLHVIDVNLGRAVQSAPSYTLGTAFQNPWWNPVWVQLAGGTVTNVEIGPTSAAATTSLATSTPVTFALPSGWWLNITGTVKPTTFNVVPL